MCRQFFAFKYSPSVTATMQPYFLIPLCLLAVCILSSTCLREGMFCFLDEYLSKHKNSVKQEHQLIFGNTIKHSEKTWFSCCPVLESCKYFAMHHFAVALNDCTGCETLENEIHCVLQIAIKNVFYFIQEGEQQARISRSFCFLSRMYQIPNLSCWRKFYQLNFATKKRFSLLYRNEGSNYFLTILLKQYRKVIIKAQLWVKI